MLVNVDYSLCLTIIYSIVQLTCTQEGAKTPSYEEIRANNIRNAEQEFYSTTPIVMPKFNYLLNPGAKVCNQGVKPFVLVYIHSAPGNLKKRLIIRETWASKSLFKDARVLFMLGDTEETRVKTLIKYEYDSYEDIIQQDFIDNYRNLTYKGIMALNWITDNCPDVKYVLKTDDDIFVNTFALMNHLKFLYKRKEIISNKIMCLLWDGMVVLRNPEDKW